MIWCGVWFFSFSSCCGWVGLGLSRGLNRVSEVRVDSIKQEDNTSTKSLLQLNTLPRNVSTLRKRRNRHNPPILRQVELQSAEVSRIVARMRQLHQGSVVDGDLVVSGILRTAFDEGDLASEGADEQGRVPGASENVCEDGRWLGGL